MIKYNLQFFGGRGSSSGKYSSNSAARVRWHSGTASSSAVRSNEVRNKMAGGLLNRIYKKKKEDDQEKKVNNK